MIGPNERYDKKSSIKFERRRYLAWNRRGRRLIHGDSFDSYLESLTAKQSLAELNPSEAA
jgi:hypothetical protein